jgi:hypothetical protein
MGASDGATHEREPLPAIGKRRRSRSTEIGVEMRYTRGGGPSGATIGLGRRCQDADERRDIDSCVSKSTRSGRTARDPTNPTRTASLGSAVLRHEQSDFDRGLAGVEWCIGHVA